jgi:hypothetical protein
MFMDSYSLGKKMSLMNLFTNLKRSKYADLVYVPRSQDFSQMVWNKGLDLRRHINKT